MRVALIFCSILSTISSFLVAGISWPYKNIHIIGDSNAPYNFTQYPDRIPGQHVPSPDISLYEVSQLAYEIQNQWLSAPCFIHWLQGRTLHRIGRDGLAFNFQQYNVNEEDVVVLLFGAIDVGGHIYRAEEDTFLPRQLATRDLDEILETLAHSLIQTVLLNKALYNNITIVISAVTPPIDHPYFAEDFAQLFPNESFIQKQIEITKKLNAGLEHYCNLHDCLYLDVNRYFEDEIGQLRTELSAGDHHIHPKHNHIIKDALFSLLLNHAKTSTLLP